MIVDYCENGEQGTYASSIDPSGKKWIDAHLCLAKHWDSNDRRESGKMCKYTLIADNLQLAIVNPDGNFTAPALSAPASRIQILAGIDSMSDYFSEYSENSYAWSSSKVTDYVTISYKHKVSEDSDEY